MNPISSNTYRTLPGDFYSDDAPLPVNRPRLFALNEPLLNEYGLARDWFRSPEGLNVLSGNSINRENPPVALAYAGYQFGHHVPLLGDGRAHLLGQMHVNDADIAEGFVDVQLKGSGRTRFSRGGDGRATLASALREYIVSEAMAGLGIPTTRSLAVIATGEPVYREQPEKGGILVRTARSHVRVGTFHYAADTLGTDAVEALAEHVINAHFPELVGRRDRYAQFIADVVERQAALIARWMLVGFIHGVMNTDNMSIVGETIDFGPCAFMDEFNTEKVFSSIDQRGRYAWANQPGIALWNLTRFAASLLPLLTDDADEARSQAEAQLGRFNAAFQQAFYAGMGRKLGLPEALDAEARLRFADATLMLLHEHGLDYTVFFDQLTRVALGEPATLLHAMFPDRATADTWLDQWAAVKADDPRATMRQANPAVIARNHRVEAALRAAVIDDDAEPTLRLVRALRSPWSVNDDDAELQTPPRPEERVTKTFCGT